MLVHHLLKIVTVCMRKISHVVYLKKGDEILFKENNIDLQQKTCFLFDENNRECQCFVDIARFS